MSIREEQCRKVCRILDDVLANRPTERDALCVDVDKAFEALKSEQQRTGKWILDRSGAYCCSECMEPCAGYVMMKPRDRFCKMCGAKMEGAGNESD